MRAGHSSFVRAMGAAIKRADRLDPVPDDPAIAMFARRRERVDGAFKAVERVRAPRT